VDAAFPDLPRLDLDRNASLYLRQGRVLPLEMPGGGGTARAYDAAGRFLGLVEPAPGGGVRVARLFVPGASRADPKQLEESGCCRLECAAHTKGNKVRGFHTMALSTERKAEIVHRLQRGTNDTGSPEVQIAFSPPASTTSASTFNVHKSDHSSRRGLLKLVTQRRKLLDYLKATDLARYQEVVAKLGLRR